MLRLMHRWSLFAPALLGITLLVVGWQLLVMLFDLPRYILPGPERVAMTLWANRVLLLHHGMITLVEIMVGFCLGVLLGVMTALALIIMPTLRRTLLPLLLITQAIPVFALAPILMLWFGYGMLSKIIMAMLIIYFPVTSNSYDGLRQTPQEWLDLSTTMGATSLRRLWYIRIPAALPSFASGLRMAATAAPIGAVIGEWVGSSAGLGYLMLQANGRMQTDLMFAALVVLVIFAVAFYFLVDGLCRRLLPWQPDRRHNDD
ncbi:ABC transporter permease [Kushneria phosphatilytica]|nr:ABC transporter permease [Kushneria phosphatilytica]